MATAEPESVREIERLRGLSYRSPWFLIDQRMVDAFACVTGDHQYIHVDAERAALTSFGGTIAHGFLLLAILPQLHAQSDRPRIPSLAMAINYGFDRVRFVSPVRTSSRVRAHFTVAALTAVRPGQWQQELDVCLEVEGSERPAVAARWLSRFTLAA
jgi:acyl dehydratase